VRGRGWLLWHRQSSRFIGKPDTWGDTSDSGDLLAMPDGLARYEEGGGYF